MVWNLVGTEVRLAAGDDVLIVSYCGERAQGVCECRCGLQLIERGFLLFELKNYLQLNGQVLWADDGLTGFDQSQASDGACGAIVTCTLLVC
ncbi:hypothetical protein EVAR_90620_1 [Eumeta japonica]|uniref:Uncharacterized protein n=1 Tax=Eumeta variegata TaxID=151549 RepID=A0A4C1ZQ16_EUMVA|nr:hypothetical protein EVAR_90620_1 [Eumeta japonica]